MLLFLLSEIVGNTIKMCGYWDGEKETVVIALKDKANLPLHTFERKYKDVQNNLTVCNCEIKFFITTTLRSNLL